MVKYPEQNQIVPFFSGSYCCLISAESLLFGGLKQALYNVLLTISEIHL